MKQINRIIDNIRMMNRYERGIGDMDNVITITLKEKPEKDYQATFESNPTSSELVAAILLLQEVLEHNFDRQEILIKFATMYGRLQDLEEVKRT